MYVVWYYAISALVTFGFFPDVAKNVLKERWSIVIASTAAFLTFWPLILIDRLIGGPIKK